MFKTFDTLHADFILPPESKNVWTKIRPICFQIVEPDQGQNCLFVCLFVFVALRPKSTAMVIAGRSVHLTTLFPGQA